MVAATAGWEFPHCTVVRVKDGDTIELDIDLGFSITRRIAMRLLGLNAIELHDPGGAEAQANLAGLLPAGTPVSLVSVRDDKYAPRYDAVVTLRDGTPLAALLISTGWAAPWNGKGTAPVPDWPRP
jgi:endonuclease YncB( thermonuclease family)